MQHVVYFSVYVFIAGLFCYGIGSSLDQAMCNTLNDAVHIYYLANIYTIGYLFNLLPLTICN